MLSRTRCAPRPGRRTLPRFILLISSIACLLLTIEGFTTEWLMRNAFSGFLDKEVQRAFGNRMDALTGTTSLYQILKEENGRRGGDVFSLIKMAARDLGSEDVGVKAVQEAERKVRGADRALAYLALSGAFTFFFFSFVVYGAGNSRFRAANWLYGLFNGQDEKKDLLLDDESGPSVPDLLSQIILDWAINSANVSDSLFFEIDVHVLAELCAISGKSADSRLREEFAKRLCRLCSVPIKLRYNRGDWSLCWEGIALVPAKGVEPGEAGAYRLETNLTSSVKGNFLARQLPRESYAVPLLCGPVVYELWKAMWDLRTSGSDKGVQVGEAKCTLQQLLQDSGIRFDRENQHASLDRLHKGLDSLRSHGFIEGWTITEGGRASPASWYERVKLFHYDKEQCAYRLDRKLLDRKVYRFWCGGTTTPLPPPKPVVLKNKNKKKKKLVKDTPIVKTDVTLEEPETIVEVHRPKPVVIIDEPIKEKVIVIDDEPEEVRDEVHEKAHENVPEETILVIDEPDEVAEEAIEKAVEKALEEEPTPTYITLGQENLSCNDESELIAAAVEYVEKGFSSRQVHSVQTFSVSNGSLEETSLSGKDQTATSFLATIVLGRGRFAAYKTRRVKMKQDKTAYKKSTRKKRNRAKVRGKERRDRI